jgi:hypothetical protein
MKMQQPPRQLGRGVSEWLPWPAACARSRLALRGFRRVDVGEPDPVADTVHRHVHRVTVIHVLHGGLHSALQRGLHRFAGPGGCASSQS